MMFKNTIKLVMSNFHNFWKLLLYKIVTYSFVALLLSLFINSITVASNTSGLWVNLKNVMTSFALSNDIILLMQNLFLLLQSILGFFVALFETKVFAGTLVTFIIFILFPFLSNWCKIPFGENYYGYMSSLARFGFMQKFITKIGVSSVYSIFKTLMNIIFTVVLFIGNYYILSLSFSSNFVVYLVPILFVVFTIGLISLYQTFLCGYSSACVVFSDGGVKGFRQGLKAVGRRFFRTLSNIIVINTLTACVFYVFGIYSLIVLIPLYADIIITFEMVMFFGSNGMRYYVDLDTILTPKKLETYDKYNKVKDLI